jgi:ubiquinone/menaquinone biosynthesis C-methylase UbiE
MRLRVSELPRIDTNSGICDGSIIFLQPRDMRDVDEFEISIDRRLSHEVMWEVYAASHDRIHSELPFYQQVVDRHCMAMEPAHIRTICDVGTGTGIPTARLLKLGKYVTAVSTNRAMLQKLRNRLGPGYHERLTVIEDSAENLPQLPDAGFDGVSVLLAFFDMADPLSALREAQRLLKPGGVLIVTEPRACFDMDALMKASQEWLRDHGLLEELGEDWQRIETIAPLIRDKIRDIQTHTSATALQQGWHAEAILEILRRDGFASLTFRKSHLDNCATIMGEKPLRAS